MRWSWLASPAVALLNLLAAAIAVGDWLRRLARIMIRGLRGVKGVIESPEPVSIQFANTLDRVGYYLAYLINPRDPVRFPRLFVASTVPLTTWLQRPAASVGSYRRHIRTWREFEAAGLPMR